MATLRKGAANPVMNHPFVTKLNRSIRLDDEDLTALARLLNHKIVVKKTKDIIVEGYEYKGLHVVERGFAIRYRLLHNGKRQIVNIILPGDIIGFPACFFDRVELRSPEPRRRHWPKMGESSLSTEASYTSEVPR